MSLKALLLTACLIFSGSTTHKEAKSTQIQQLEQAAGKLSSQYAEIYSYKSKYTGVQGTKISGVFLIFIMNISSI